MLDKGEAIKRTNSDPEIFSTTVKEMMNILDQERVAVSATSVPNDRNGFHPQINVTGKLDIRLQIYTKQPKYRVIVNQDTYTYFEPSNVQTILLLPEEDAKRRKIAAIIYIAITTEEYRRYKTGNVWMN